MRLEGLSAEISRRNPQDDYELIQRIGSGTYGDVYKVLDDLIIFFQTFCFCHMEKSFKIECFHQITNLACFHYYANWFCCIWSGTANSKCIPLSTALLKSVFHTKPLLTLLPTLATLIFFLVHSTSHFNALIWYTI